MLHGGLTPRHSRIDHNLAELICGDPQFGKFPENIPGTGKLDRKPTRAAVYTDWIRENLQKKDICSALAGISFCSRLQVAKSNPGVRRP
jgi:hypothetical protein